MAVTPDGEVVKKKRVDGPIAFKSVPIEPLQLKKVSEGSTGGATLKVQTQKEHYVTQPAHQVHTEVKKTQATPPLPAVSATSTGITNTVQIPPSAPVVGTDGRKLKLLDQLKEKQLQDMAARSLKEERNPVYEEVKMLWDKYLETLKTQQKHTAVTSFQLANLSVEGNEVIIRSVSIINQKFIEGEATSFLEILKAHFQNINVKIRFLLEEDDKTPKALEPKYLNSTERYKMMAEEYPLVRELKEKLRLELKY